MLKENKNFIFWSIVVLALAYWLTDSIIECLFASFLVLILSSLNRLSDKEEKIEDELEKEKERDLIAKRIREELSKN